MAAISGLVVLIPALLLPHGSTAATLTSQKGTNIVRREPQSVRLAPHGEIQHNAKHHHSHKHGHHSHHGKPHTMVKQSSQVTVVDNTKITAQEKAALAQAFCDYDFPMGKEGTSNCTEDPSANNSLILTESMCIQAGLESGATTSGASFRLGQEWEDKHPKGCFKDKCSEASSTNSICYFYNGVGDWPQDTQEGTPVCSRKKHLHGKNGSTGVGDDTSCPEGYVVIDDEEKCSSTANCLSLTTGSEFRIGMQNASKHGDYPRGCFISNDDDKVYYNAENALKASGTGGTPLCLVAKAVKWGGSDTAADATAEKKTDDAADAKKADDGAEEKADDSTEKKADEGTEKKADEGAEKKADDAEEKTEEKK